MNHRNEFDTNIQSDSECNDCRGYEKEIKRLRAENSRLLEEKAKLIEDNKNLIQAISDIRQRT